MKLIILKKNLKSRDNIWIYFSLHPYIRPLEGGSEHALKWGFDLHYYAFCFNMTEKMSGVYLWLLGDRRKYSSWHLKSDTMKVKWPSKPPLILWPWTLIPPHWSVGLFPCLLGHMSMLTYCDRQMQVDTHTKKPLIPLIYHKLIYVPGHKGPHRCDHMTSGSVWRVVIIALLGLLHQRSLWQDTRRQMLRAKREHFHLCEIRVSNLIMTAGHTQDT